jgi:chromosome partitioning protein
MDIHGISLAKSEIRTCGWLAQVDEHGGSIFHWRPHAKGAMDMTSLLDEVLTLLTQDDGTLTAFLPPIVTVTATMPPAVGEGEAVMPNPSVNQTQHGEAA